MSNRDMHILRPDTFHFRRSRGLMHPVEGFGLRTPPRHPKLEVVMSRPTDPEAPRPDMAQMPDADPSDADAAWADAALWRDWPDRVAASHARETDEDARRAARMWGAAFLYAGMVLAGLLAWLIVSLI